MIEGGADGLYFIPKNRFLAEITADKDPDPDQQAIRMFLRDVLLEPIRGILILQRFHSSTPSRIESVVFADLRMNDPVSEKIVENVVDADALLDQRITPPIHQGQVL